jgi:predicted acetyltransferase
MPELAAPSAIYRDSFIAALEEFGPDEGGLTYEREVTPADFDDYVRVCAANARGEELPDGWVPYSTFWLVEGDEYIGSVNVRHVITDWMRRFGGHIGHHVRSSQRRKGYGTLICALALDEARKLGLDRVLITCDDDNMGSAKIIERNGGVTGSARSVDA